jgi:hypothetical protein
MNLRGWDVSVQDAVLLTYSRFRGTMLFPEYWLGGNLTDDQKVGISNFGDKNQSEIELLLSFDCVISESTSWVEARVLSRGRRELENEPRIDSSTSSDLF